MLPFRSLILAAGSPEAGAATGLDPSHRWLYLALAGAGLLCVLAWAMAAHYLRLTRSLRASEARHRFLADHAGDVIWTMDLEGRLTYVSPSVQKLRGFSPEEVMGQSLREILTPESAAIAEERLHLAQAEIREGRPAPEFRGELEQPCRDGSTVWTEVTVTGMTDGQGRCVGFLGVTRDISERRRLQEELKARAATDLLTGVWNRFRLEEMGQAEVHRQARYGQPLALVFMDLDRFKRVNDTHGHEAGDRVLQAFCATVRTCLRETDLFGRWGGEEFLVLVPGTDAPSARLLAERIRQAMEAQELPGIGRVTVSAGVAACRPGDSWPVLVARADAALYRAKSRGRNRVESEDGVPEPPRESFLNLVWTEAHASGHPLLDAQHRSLVEHANGLLHLLLDPGSHAGAEGRVADLLEEVLAHFETEQALLEQTGYPDAQAHAALHRDLMRRGLELAELFWAGQLPPNDLVGFFLYELISKHMLQEDRAFFPHFRPEGRVASP